MSIFEEGETLFQETMYPKPGFSNRVHGRVSNDETSNDTPEATLPPYEPTLGDAHDTHPDEDATRVVPISGNVKRILNHVIEVPEYMPDDN